MNVRLATMSLSYVEQLKQFPKKPGEIWQGAAIRLPAWVDEPGESRPFRPMVFLWTCVASGLVGTTEDSFGSTAEMDLGVVLASLAAFAGKEMGGVRPERLEVRDAELAELLKSALAEVGIEIAYRAWLPALDACVDTLSERFRGEELLPGFLDGKDVTVERVRAFAEAAADFCTAAPWRLFTNEDLIKIESPRGDAALRYAIVLGAGGEEFGLAFHRSIDDFWNSYGIPEEHQRDALDQGVWSITFCQITEIPLADADLWEDHSLPVAYDAAYPLAVRFYTLRTRRPNARVLSFFEGLMRALATTVEDDLARGRWERAVTTSDGDIEYSFSMPLLLDPPPPEVVRRNGFHDRRAVEATSAQISRFLAGKDFSDIDEINAAVQKEFSGLPSERREYPPRTPLEEAQDLCYEAFDSIGYRRVVLARRAIEHSGDCADAYVLLAEASASPQEQADLYAEGVEAGKRALGDRFFQEETESIWGHLAARPFMRALRGLASSNARLGRTGEAIAQYQELLRLNPGDNQGNRYDFLALLIVAEQDDDAEALISTYADTDAAWLYGKALLAFRREGDEETSQRALRKAIKANPLVPDLLLDDEERVLSFRTDRSSEEWDALFCAELLQLAWEITPDALDWLEARSQRGR